MDEILMPDEMLYGSTGVPVMSICQAFDSWLADRADLVALIQNECREHDISEVYALALMQKEQSAFFRATPPSQRAQDWLYGYGCPEVGGRMSRFQGIENQIRHAIGQFERYKKWPGVKTLSPQRLYDSKETLRALGFKSPYTPRSLAEAASLTYNPRAEGLVNQIAIIKRIQAGPHPK